MQSGFFFLVYYQLLILETVVTRQDDPVLQVWRCYLLLEIVLFAYRINCLTIFGPTAFYVMAPSILLRPLCMVEQFFQKIFKEAKTAP